jgi:transcriptional regulator with XRE-family HTH domain
MTTEKNKVTFGTAELEKKLGPTTFGKLLINYRFALGLNQIALAKKLGLSRANICDLEKGRRVPSAGRAFAMAKKLKEPAQYWVQIALQDELRAHKINYVVKIELEKKVA